jgi:hypothetical protein
MLAISSALPLLESRDHYVSAFSEEATHLFELSPKVGTPDELRRLAEKEADAVYGRRGAALPLHAINLILSTLLFSGCVRTLRGLSTGPSMVRFAAAASIPLHLLDAAYSLVQTRDLEGALTQVAPALQILVRTQLLPARNAFVVLKASLAVGYFLVCLLYLRRRAVTAQFSDGGGSGSSSP